MKRGKKKKTVISGEGRMLASLFLPSWTVWKPKVLRKFSHDPPALPIAGLLLGYHCQIFENF